MFCDNNDFFSIKLLVSLSLQQSDKLFYFLLFMSNFGIKFLHDDCVIGNVMIYLIIVLPILNNFGFYEKQAAEMNGD